VLPKKENIEEKGGEHDMMHGTWDMRRQHLRICVKGHVITVVMLDNARRYAKTRRRVGNSSKIDR
jgi:hypothetical protein